MSKIITEAFSVYRRTGLTPGQMEKRARELEAVVRAALKTAQIEEQPFRNWHNQAVDILSESLPNTVAETPSGQAPAAQKPAPSAAAALPEGWVPLAITHAGQYPEGVAYAKAQAAPAADATTVPEGWTDADADAARLALELECLLMDTKDAAVVSKWWASANDALEMHRTRLKDMPPPATQSDRLLKLADELDEQLTSGAKWSPAQHACCNVSTALRDIAQSPSPKAPTPQADSAQDEPLQAFDSPRAKALMRAWEEGWAACRDAEYVGEEAQNDAFNSSHTLTLCIAEDQQLPAPQADSQPPMWR